MTDAALIALFQARDEQAIAETERKYGAYCQSLASRIVSAEDAEECVSDSFLKLWEHIPPEQPRSLKAYLTTIVRRVALHRYEQNHAARRDGGIPVLLEELAECLPSGETAESALAARELTATISAFLRTLPEFDRTVFLRRYYLGQSVQELAYEAGYTPAKLASRLYRTRQKLRRALEKEELL